MGGVEFQIVTVLKFGELKAGSSNNPPFERLFTARRVKVVVENDVIDLSPHNSETEIDPTATRLIIMENIGV